MNRRSVFDPREVSVLGSFLCIYETAIKDSLINFFYLKKGDSKYFPRLRFLEDTFNYQILALRRINATGAINDFLNAKWQIIAQALVMWHEQGNQASFPFLLVDPEFFPKLRAWADMDSTPIPRYKKRSQDLFPIEKNPDRPYVIYGIDFYRLPAALEKPKVFHFNNFCEQLIMRLLLEDLAKDNLLSLGSCCPKSFIAPCFLHKKGAPYHFQWLSLKKIAATRFYFTACAARIPLPERGLITHPFIS